ncbi:MAG: class I SAM-dependent methyltransferase, partial [Clostridiales Family XIII bacterium]|nr:class I SAM-dependent methyltransferase [Clostridiales Family XIII bacterium]
EENDIALLEDISLDHIDIQEMQKSERAFLTGLIRRENPRKILEVGVSAGASSLVILNAIKDMECEKLFSIDITKEWYRDKSRLTGWAIDRYPHLKEKHALYAGDMACAFLDEIGDGIDFCLIDTVHANPGEILDFLMVLPYLKENATVVFHDTKFHCWGIVEKPAWREWSITTNELLSAVVGKKIVNNGMVYTPEMEKFDQSKEMFFPNIAAVKINAETRTNIFDVFNLLTVHWDYIPTKVHWQKFCTHIFRHYGTYYLEYLQRVYSYYVDFYSETARVNNLAVEARLEQEKQQNAEREALEQEILRLKAEQEASVQEISRLDAEREASALEISRLETERKKAMRKLQQTRKELIKYKKPRVKLAARKLLGAVKRAVLRRVGGHR